MKILCYGDSNTYGYDPQGGGSRYPSESRWVNLLDMELRSCCVMNAGQNGREIPTNGWESARGVAMQMEAATEPGDFLIIMLGSNDLLLGGMSAENACQRMKTFLTAVMERNSGRKILLVGPVKMKPGFWVTEEGLVEESEQLIREYEKMVSELEGVDFADSNLWGVELTGDGVHFTKEGHKAFAEGLTKHLKLCYSIG